MGLCSFFKSSHDLNTLLTCLLPFRSPHTTALKYQQPQRICAEKEHLLQDTDNNLVYICWHSLKDLVTLQNISFATLMDGKLVMNIAG